MLSPTTPIFRIYVSVLPDPVPMRTTGTLIFIFPGLITEATNGELTVTPVQRNGIVPTGDVLAGLTARAKLGDDLKTTVSDVVRANSADASAHFACRDMLFQKEFAENERGELTRLGDEAVANLRRYSM